jgi:hypothetical protein
LYKYGIVNVDRFSYTLVELREISLRPKLKRMAICKGTMEWNDRKKIMAMKYFMVYTCRHGLMVTYLIFPGEMHGGSRVPHTPILGKIKIKKDKNSSNFF